MCVGGWGGGQAFLALQCGARSGPWGGCSGRGGVEALLSHRVHRALPPRVAPGVASGRCGSERRHSGGPQPHVQPRAVHRFGNGQLAAVTGGFVPPPLCPPPVINTETRSIVAFWPSGFTAVVWQTSAPFRAPQCARPSHPVDRPHLLTIQTPRHHTHSLFCECQRQPEALKNAPRPLPPPQTHTQTPMVISSRYHPPPPLPRRPPKLWHSERT
jgi:hypothetical protein